MSGSERLAQEHERILREIRLSLSTFDAAISGPARKRRKGTVYASVSITTGRRLYLVTRKLGFSSPQQFKREKPDLFAQRVMGPNIRDAIRFEERLGGSWSQVINPARFFADGWTQEHFMMLWDQAIRRYASSVAFSADAASTGRGKEVLIALDAGKRLFDENGDALHPLVAAERIARAADWVDGLGFDAGPLYTSHMQIKLKLDELKQRGRRIPA